jgi:hypothetical protein
MPRERGRVSNRSLPTPLLSPGKPGQAKPSQAKPSQAEITPTVTVFAYAHTPGSLDLAFDLIAS